MLPDLADAAGDAEAGFGEAALAGLGAQRRAGEHEEAEGTERQCDPDELACRIIALLKEAGVVLAITSRQGRCAGVKLPQVGSRVAQDSISLGSRDDDVITFGSFSLISKGRLTVGVGGCRTQAADQAYLAGACRTAGCAVQEQIDLLAGREACQRNCKRISRAAVKPVGAEINPCRAERLHLTDDCYAPRGGAGGRSRGGSTTVTLPVASTTAFRSAVMVHAPAAFSGLGDQISIIPESGLIAVSTMVPPAFVTV